LDIEQKIEQIKIEKNKVVRSQKYEEAAKLRDTEKHLLEELDQAKACLGSRNKIKTLHRNRR
jgi:ATP-dependent Clp protease ATP-binding subunit ClpC